MSLFSTVANYGGKQPTNSQNIKQFGTKSRDEEQSVSTEKSKSLFGDNLGSPVIIE